MKLFTVILLLCTLLFADYDEHEHGEYEYKKHHLPLDMRYLHLDQKQLKEVKDVIKTFRREYRLFHQKKESTQKEISTLFLSEKFDTEKFIRLSTELNRYSAGMQAKFFSRMHKILTTKQRKRFIHYMEEWEVE